MPLSFLAPWFLAGLALVAVPIVVHLVQRERKRPVMFPSLMFVRRIPHKATRRRSLRDLLLFLMRCAAVALVAAAFARPLLDRTRAAAAAGAAGREVVVLVDRSYSMSADGRWDRAKAMARAAIDGLRPGDRATVVAFDAAPAGITEATEDRAALRRGVDTLTVGAGVTRYAPALALASRVLAQSPLARREAILITDFQRAGWRDSSLAGTDAEARLPSGAVLTPIDVSGREGSVAADVAVTGVELRRELVDGRERVRATARVVRAGGAAPDALPGRPAPARTVPVTLEIGGRVTQSRAVVVPPNGAAQAVFDPIPVPEGWTRATVRAAAGDALPADDAFHFAVSRGQVVRVLLVERDGGRGDGGLYVQRALAVGDQPPFRVDVTRASELTAKQLADHQLVIADDAPPAGGAARLLEGYVRAGGGLLVATGEASAGSAWRPARALLAAEVGSVVDRDAGARLATLERSHPVFLPFSVPRSGDLSAPRTVRYRELTPAADATVIARFDDGAPALVERQVGLGRVLMWASTLDSYWTDLPLQPVYVPLVQQMATRAAGYAESRAWHVAGETVDLARLAGEVAAADTAGWVVVTPSRRQVRIESLPRTRRGAAVGQASSAGALTLTEAGFYEARPASGRTDRTLAIAVNVDPSEADPSRIEPAELVRAVAPDPGQSAPPPAATPLTRDEREQRQGAWWWLLLGALVLLAGETLLSNRLTRRRAPQTA